MQQAITGTESFMKRRSADENQERTVRVRISAGRSVEVEFSSAERAKEFRKLNGELRRAKGKEAKEAVRMRMWRCFMEPPTEHNIQQLADALLRRRQLDQLARHELLDTSQRRTARSHRHGARQDIADWALDKDVAPEHVRLARKAVKSAKNKRYLMAILRRIFIGREIRISRAPA